VARDQNVMERADSLATSDNPPRWSRAELQQRLERLPVGHPSSPRLDPAAENDLHDRADQEADGVKRDFWTELPRFLKAWADHVSTWPSERIASTVDRSRDPAGSWRGDGGQYLNPRQHAQTKDIIEKVRQREEKITQDIEQVRSENSCGGWLEGLEHRCKGDDRLKEKIAGELAITPATNPETAIKRLNDAIRYTFCFNQSDYSDGYWDVKHRLEALDYQMVYSKNHWRDDPEYKGINTRWVTPEGQRFEVQFHTKESFHAKHEVTHECYERLRNPLTPDHERGELEAFQREVSLWIAVPDSVRQIPDHATRGR
jgi:hypothetical protein